MSQQFDNFYLLSSKQRKFILNNDEILTDLLKTNLSEKRFVHSLGVAKLAKELASFHNVDLHKAYIAGLLHDVAKELSAEESDLYLKYYDFEKLSCPAKVKHSYVGKYYLKDKLNFNDKDILNAIYNHTVCASFDKLSLIVYIADKREENRHIDDEVVGVAKKDLKKAYFILRRKFEEKNVEG